MSTPARSLVIVITGASRGLGAGMAEAYLKKGHKLGLCARSRSAPSFVGASSKGGDSALYRSVDVTDPEAVDSFLRAVVVKFGRPIDLWINNAGVLGPIKPIRDTDCREFEFNVQVNLMGVFHATKAFVRHRTSGPGRGGDATLVNISSGASTKGYSGWGAYCSSKGGVDRLTECAFLEEKEGGGGGNFRAYSIAPGVIDTDMQATIRSSSKEDFPMLDKFLKIKAEDSFNSPPYVAECIERLALMEGPQTAPVVQRLPNEK